jgi:HTH-type transcriptional regulator/antitoxin HipB
MNSRIDLAEQLSVHIKSLRKAHSLTQAQLGMRIGVKQARMADIERTPGVVSVAQMLQVLYALDARLLLSSSPDSKEVPADSVLGKADW